MTDPMIVDCDRVLGFTIPARDARGRMARLGPVVSQVLTAHDYPPPVEALLGEALTLGALIGATLKDASGQLTMQAQTQTGIVRLMVCDYRGGELRGYVDYDADRLAALADPWGLAALFGGDAYLAITFDLATTGERYQGIVPLDGTTLAEAVESYFAQSEQIPTLVRAAFARGPGGDHVAGGLLLQHLPDGEEGRERLHTQLDHPEWERVAILGRTLGLDELTDPTLSLETLVWRLFNEEEEVRLLPHLTLAKGCRCSPDYIAGVLAKFPTAEQAAMADEDGIITVDCAFCATKFPIRAAGV
ncbi:MAG: molecular chaperone Hsp33 [Sphingobium sp.]|nr:molecular chaperone Hsp33 [Sphingobium sp.]